MKLSFDRVQSYKLQLWAIANGIALSIGPMADVELDAISALVMKRIDVELDKIRNLKEGNEKP